MLQVGGNTAVPNTPLHDYPEPIQGQFEARLVVMMASG
jgi:hypothetical protein